MSLLRIPVWPECKQGEVSMSFLHGEAGWYLWLLHKQGADLSRVERDMMLLYNNGDLRNYPQELKPETGLYVCTLNENKIIRGLILNKYKNVDPEAGSVHLLDVDGGRVLTVPITNLKVLPTFATKAAARAVRCDLGLDCLERFSWPSQLDDMLKRALAGGELLVEFESERPGSIPTVSVTARLWNSSLGITIDFREWLVQFFGPHLEINGLNDYLPTLVVSEKLPESAAAEAPSPSVLSPTSPELSVYPRREPPVANPGFPSVPPGFHPLPLAANNMFQGYGYPAFSWNWPRNMNLVTFDNTSQFRPAVPFNVGPQSIPQTTASDTLQPLNASSESPHNCEQLERIMMLNEERNLRSRSPVLTVESVKEAISPSPPRKKEAAIAETQVLGQADAGPKFVETNLKHMEISPKHAEVSSKQVKISSEHVAASSKRVDISPKHAEDISKHVEIAPKHVAGSPERVEISPTHVETNGLPKTTRENEHTLSELKRHWHNGTVIHVVISFIASPDLFSGVVDEDASLAYFLQKELMDIYSKSSPLPVITKEAVEDVVGTFCVCYDEAERFWFRAEVQEWNFHEPDKPVNVWCVDFGGFYDVPLKWIRRLEGALVMRSPVLSAFFEMHNVRPRQPPLVYEWPQDHCVEIRKILHVDQEYWVRIEGPSREGVWPVSVFKGKDCESPCLNDVLVEKQLAFYCRSIPEHNQPSVESVTGRGEWNPMEEDYLRGRNMNVDDEDACFAVSGFKPRNEGSVCRFFQAEGNCRKGLNCRQRHVRLREGGWADEKELIYTKAFHQLTLPSEGSVVNMNITRFLNVHRFFGVLVPDKAIPSEEDYQLLLQRLNNPASNSTFEFLTVSPALGQLVIAKHKSGKYWFRGRVIESHVDDEDIFEVCDVDTGIQMWLHVNDLRLMNPTYLYLPFQAIECYLADMTPVKKDLEFAKKGLQALRDLVRNHTVKAYIVKRNIDDALEVKLTTSTGQDIATILSQRGFVEKGTTRITAKPVYRFIPG